MKEFDKDEKTKSSGVEKGDREAELPCKDCGSKEHKTSEHKGKKSKKYEERKKELAAKHK